MFILGDGVLRIAPLFLKIDDLELINEFADALEYASV